MLLQLHVLHSRIKAHLKRLAHVATAVRTSESCLRSWQVWSTLVSERAEEHVNPAALQQRASVGREGPLRTLRCCFGHVSIYCSQRPCDSFRIHRPKRKSPSSHGVVTPGHTLTDGPGKEKKRGPPCPPHHCQISIWSGSYRSEDDRICVSRSEFACHR